MSTGKIIGLSFVAIIGMMFLSWTLGWLAVPGSVMSAKNVREQWRFAYEYEESLRSAARKVCMTEKALANAGSDVEKTQRRSHLLTMEQNYARIQAEYDGRLRDAFQAKLVAPSDVGNRAPELHDMKSEVCPQ